MEQVTAYKTMDGKIFSTKEEAQSYEQEVYNLKLLKIKEEYVKERLKESCYGYLFVDQYAPRKSTHILPDSPLVNVLIRDSKLVKEIIDHLETIK